MREKPKIKVLSLSARSKAAQRYVQPNKKLQLKSL